MAASMAPTNIGPDPTIGSLEQMIIMDAYLQQWEKQQALAQLKRDLGYMPDSTPLSPDVLAKIGGGVLGGLIASYFGMGLLGMTIAGMAGYGIGKTISDFYKPGNKVRWT